MALKPTEQSSKANHAKTAFHFGTSFCPASLYWELGAVGEVHRDLAEQSWAGSWVESWVERLGFEILLCCSRTHGRGVGVNSKAEMGPVCCHHTRGSSSPGLILETRERGKTFQLVMEKLA